MAPVIFQNTQTLYYVNSRLLKKQAVTLLKLMKLEDYYFSIRITCDRTVKQLNYDTRGLKKKTDVLSFPNFQLKPGERPTLYFGTKDLGEMVFGMGYINKWCKENKTKVQDRMTLLLVHSFLHLLGYDHIKDAEYRQMRRKENQLLIQLKATNMNKVVIPRMKPEAVDIEYEEDDGNLD